MCSVYTHTPSWIVNDLKKHHLQMQKQQLFNYLFTLTQLYRKHYQALEILYTYKTSEYVMQFLYSESQTPNKCKTVLKKRRCCGLQLCSSKKTVYPAKYSFLTVCPCQSNVYTCLVALTAPAQFLQSPPQLQVSAAGQKTQQHLSP